MYIYIYMSKHLTRTHDILYPMVFGSSKLPPRSGKMLQQQIFSRFRALKAFTNSRFTCQSSWEPRKHRNNDIEVTWNHVAQEGPECQSFVLFSCAWPERASCHSECSDAERISVKNATGSLVSVAQWLYLPIGDAAWESILWSSLVFPRGPVGVRKGDTWVTSSAGNDHCWWDFALPAIFDDQRAPRIACYTYIHTYIHTYIRKPLEGHPSDKRIFVYTFIHILSLLSARVSHPF